MHCAHRTLCLAGGLLPAFLLGCYSSYPYGTGSPGMYSGPPPAGVVVPQGAPPPGQFFQPGPSMTPAPVPGGETQGWQAPSTSGDAPGWDPNNNPNPVPDYGDPENLQAPPQTFGPSSKNQKKDSAASYNGASIDATTDVRVASAEMDAEFKDPIEQASGNEEPEQLPEEAIESAEPVTTAAASSPNPYDYDRANYRWLRGTVELDPKTKTWHMMYSVEPEENDEYGGDIALVDDPQLATLADNDVVLVEGSVDSQSLDSLGKPRYRVTRVAKLIPQKK